MYLRSRNRKLLGRDHLENRSILSSGDQAASSDDSRMADIGNVKRSEIYGKIWFNTSVGSNFGFVK